MVKYDVKNKISKILENNNKDERSNFIFSWRTRLDSREVLQNDSGRFEGDLYIFLLVLSPVEDILDILLENVEVIAVTHGRLKEDADRERQSI